METARFLFIVFIYISHCVGVNNRAPFDFGGESGVAFFFVLSGFVLSLGYGGRVADGTFSTRRFFVNHWSRLYPLHLLTMAITVALDARLGQTYALAQIVPNVLLVQTWLASNYYVCVANGVSWFLCDILFFYLIFACLYRWFMHRSVGLLCLLGAVIVVAYVPLALLVPADKVNHTLYDYPLLRVIDFSLGILLCRFYRSEWSVCLTARVRSLGTTGATCVEMLVPLVLFAAWAVYEPANVGLRCASLFWPVMPFVVYVLAATDGAKGCMARLMNWRPLMWLGSISFEFYLVHIIMLRFMQHIMHLLLGEVTEMQVFVAAFFASIVAAYAAKRWFVNPVYGAMKRARQ